MLGNERKCTLPHFPEVTSHILMKIIGGSLYEQTEMGNGSYLVRISLTGALPVTGNETNSLETYSSL